MTAADFVTLLKQPALVLKYSFKELQELAEKQPYSPMIYSLMALKAKLEKSDDQEYYLNKAAIRIPDRKKLFSLLHEPLEQPEFSSSNDDEYLLQKIDLEEIIPHIAEEKLPVQKPQANEETSVPVGENKLSEPPLVPVPMSLPEIAVEQPNLWQKTADDKSSENEKIPTVASNVPKKTAKEEEETEPPFELRKTFLQDKEQPPKIAKKGTGTSVEPAKSKDGHSFSEWLLLMKQKQEKVEKDSIFEEIHKETDDLQASIADIKEFSKKQQSAPPPAADLEMVSETLAKIYELQKKYDSAMKAYEQLMLKFPDKKAYFAARIENLKKIQ